MPMMLSGPQDNTLSITYFDNKVSCDCVFSKDSLCAGVGSACDTRSVLFNDAKQTVISLRFRLQMK